MPCSIVPSYSCLLNNPVSVCLETDVSEVQISQTKIKNIDKIYDVPEESLSSGSNLASHMCVMDHDSVESRDLSEALPGIITGKCLNVAGLQGKLDRGILDIEMSNSDLLVFLETNTDDPCFTQTMLQSYTIVPKKKPRLTSTNYKYGGIHGICVLFNDKFDHDQCIPIEGMSAECVLWVKLAVNNFTFILGASYIPCVTSRFHFDDIFDQIHGDLITLKLMNLPILLTGDLNSHIARLLDFIENDYTISEVTGCIVLEDSYPDQLDSESISKFRTSKDKMAVDSNGRNLVEFCKVEKMVVLNGRLGKDRDIGDPTCFKGQPSITDYAIANNEMLKHMQNFEVDMFDPNLSDVHAPISFSIFTSMPPVETSAVETECTDGEFTAQYETLPSYKFKWSSEECGNYRDNLQLLDLKPFKNELDEIVRAPTQKGVDNLCRNLNTKLIETAQNTNALVKCKPVSKNNPNSRGWSRPWVDSEFKSTRDEYLKAKNKLRRKGHKKVCNRKAKEWNKFRKKKETQFHVTLNKDIRKLRKSNSKAYWLLLQKSTEGAQMRSKVSLAAFLKHFKQLNEQNENGPQNNNSPHITDCKKTEDTNSALNYVFSYDEIKFIISKLKNNKSGGLDLLRNEFLKQSSDDLIEFYSLFFNLILNTGLVPDIWCKGLIMPLYKKGDPTNPDNYRGITLLSCMGKLFTACISLRISKYMDEDLKLGAEQAGFREEFSTLDHIFTLYSIIEFYKLKKGRIYCAFIDYTKAFDLIERSSLWVKLINNGVDGKVLNVIKSMYMNAKSSVKCDGKMSEFFSCQKGVRQGENLSPVLFAIYLNDFNEFIRLNCEGLSSLDNSCQAQLDIFMRLYVLLYADDTIILAETAEDLQLALDALHEYCQKWDLTVSIAKTNIVIFARGRVTKYPVFKIGSKIVKVVDDYIYLGVTFNYNGSFKKAMIKQLTQAKKAMFAILQKAKVLMLPIDIICELYERCVIPVLLYGSEIWGVENINCMEVFHRNFLRRILKTFKFTPNCMLYGETNTVDIKTKVESRMINFWLNTKFSSKMKLSVAMCSLFSKLHDDSLDPNIKWPAKIKNILSATDLEYVWFDPIVNVPSSKLLVRQRLEENFLRDWKESVQTNSQCTIYKQFKNTPKLENYIMELRGSLLFSVNHFISRVHHLPVTYNRFRNNPPKSETCQLCNQTSVGDETHYILHCQFFDLERKAHLPSHITNLLPSISESEAWNKLMSLKSKELIEFAKFVRLIIANFDYDGPPKPEQVEPEYVFRNVISRSGRPVRPPLKLDL